MAYSRSVTYDVAVRNFSAVESPSSLRHFFSGAGGTVKDVLILPSDSRSRPSVAYVRYELEVEANAAVEKFHQAELNEHVLNVTRAPPRGGARFDRGQGGVDQGRHRSGTGRRQGDPSSRFGNGNVSPRTQKRNVPPRFQNKSATEGSSTKSEEEPFQFMVVHVDEDLVVWAQVHEYGAVERLDKIVADLQTTCREASRVEEVSVGGVYAGLYHADGQWYRCKALKVQSSHVSVRYLDFGNCEMLQTKDIRMIPEDLASQPNMARPFLISGILRQDIPLAVLEKVRHLIQERDMQGIVEAPGTDDTPPVVSMNPLDKTDLVSELRQLLSEAGITVNVEVSPPSDATPPTTVGKAGNREDSTGNGAAAMLNTSRERPISPARGRRQDLQNDERVQSLKKSLESEQQQRKAAESRLNELEGSAYDRRTARLMRRINELRQVRSTVPSSSSTNDVLQNAISIATQVNPCLTTTLDSALAAETAFNDLQSDLRGMKPADGYSDAVMKRNMARRELHAAAGMFVEKASTLPIASHLAILQDCVKALKGLDHARYQQGKHDRKSSESTVQLESILEKYATWREERLQQVEAVQKSTDDCCSHFAAALQALQSCLVISTEPSPKCPMDLDQLALAIEKAIQEEIRHTRASEQECSQPGSILDDVSMAVMQKLRAEIAIVEDIQAKQEHFAGKRADLEAWLDIDSPDASQLTQIDADVRALRKQVRHKNMAISDANDDGEDTSTLEEELSSILAVLHTNMCKLDKELHKIARLLDHYPELPLLYPKMDILAFSSSAGLVKAGLLLDLYQCRLDSTASEVPTYKSTFAGRDCFIREFSATAGGVEATQQRAIKYAMAFHPCLLPTDAIFSVPPKVYVQYPHYKSVAFKEWLECKPSPYERFGVFVGIVAALGTLHSRQQVYGSLSAERIRLVLTDDNTPHPFILPHNISQETPGHSQSATNISPEVYNGEVATAASDMYDLGLLLARTIFPSFTTVRHRSNGVPTNIPQATEHKLVVLLLRHLLNSKPGQRRTAKATLCSDFFQNAPVEPSPSVLLHMGLDAVPCSELYADRQSCGGPCEEGQEKLLAPPQGNFWARFLPETNKFVQSLTPANLSALQQPCIQKVVDSPPAKDEEKKAGAMDAADCGEGTAAEDSLAAVTDSGPVGTEAVPSTVDDATNRDDNSAAAAAAPAPSGAQEDAESASDPPAASGDIPADAVASVADEPPAPSSSASAAVEPAEQDDDTNKDDVTDNKLSEGGVADEPPPLSGDEDRTATKEHSADTDV